MSKVWHSTVAELLLPYLVTDIDGTLGERGLKTLSAEVKSAVRDFVGLGGQVIFSTGRSLSDTSTIAVELELGAYTAIVGAGSETYEVVGGQSRQIREVLIGAHALERAYVVLQEIDGLFKVNDEPQEMVRPTQEIVPSVHAQCGARNVFACLKSSEAMPTVRRLNTLDGIHATTSMAWGGFHPDYTFLHITSSCGTKHDALQAYAKTIPRFFEKALVMGDDVADYGMLMIAHFAAAIGVERSDYLELIVPFRNANSMLSQVDGRPYPVGARIELFDGSELDGAATAIRTMAMAT